ncbi:unnamed protein product [Nippostrongylus brasiliensis]|uniref:C2H2-type domain-containing protein n=1 Tax=Nippostrongylus brasiliensis TaxID=27835 RepID=A0A0N4XMN8_NIPBR|nr:unnamed protein product [Nippostrongylus brasiliensis]
MGEVDLAVHIEPLSDAIKELNEQLTAFAMTTNAKLDAVADILNRQQDSLNQKLTALIQQTTPHSSCLFCSVEDNRDNHPTGRCYRFPDAVSRAVQAANLQLCNRCLQKKHQEDCGICCTYCGKDRNVLICPIKASGASSFKRRKM